MITLDATTKSLELVTTSTAGLDYYVAYTELTTSTAESLQSNGAISSATTTTILAAPAASTQRQIRYIMAVNTSSTATNTVTIQENSSSSTRRLYGAVKLYPGESVQYTASGAWTNYGVNGRILLPYRRGTPLDAYNTFIFGQSAHDGIGSWCFSRGVSPADINWSTPGLAGKAVNYSDSNDAGNFFPIKTTGDQYLTHTAQIAGDSTAWFPIDIVWRNSGLSLSSTTAQTINSVTFSPRDNNGTSDGVGIQIALINPTAATSWGNGAAITAPGTISYTNSEGTASRTGTIMPATASTGGRTFLPIRLQAGDLGVRSVQSLTFGSTLTSGTAYMIAYRVLTRPDSQYGTNEGANYAVDPVRIYPDSAILPLSMTSVTAGAQIVSLNIEVY
jgi:hypothetical protein